MGKIDTAQWKQFKIYELFYTEKVGKKFQTPTGASVKRTELTEGDIPRITVTGVNNGVWGYFYGNCKNPNYRIFENFISVSFLGTVFYQSGKASLDMKVHCLKLINKELNEYLAQYLVTCIKKSLKESKYTDQISSTVLPLIEIKLPVDKVGNPDFAYMENHMRNLEALAEDSLNKLQLAKQNANFSSVDTTQWSNFSIGSLFEIKKGTRLVKADMKDGNYPFVGASAINNGITARIANNEHIHSKNTITVSYNGSVGEAFYQNCEFWASDDVNVLYPKFNMDKYIAMFFIPILKVIGKRYAFINKWKKEDMESDFIRLPVNKAGNPDYEYMSNYIKNLENKVSGNLRRLNNI